MNRRELFQAAFAALAAAAIPIPAALEVYGRSLTMDALPSAEEIQHLMRMRDDLIQRIINPPVVLDGYIIRPIHNDYEYEALRHVNLLLEDKP